MQSDIDRLMTAYQHGHVSRRVFLGSLAALTVAGCSADESASTSAISADAVAPSAPAQTGPPIPVTSINHMTLSVSDPARRINSSLTWYGRKVASRAWASSS